MSFALVKGLGFPAISQHLKIERGALTITCGYHSQKSRVHLFLLLQTFRILVTILETVCKYVLSAPPPRYVAPPPPNLLMLPFEACSLVFLYMCTLSSGGITPPRWGLGFILCPQCPGLKERSAGVCTWVLGGLHIHRAPGGCGVCASWGGVVRGYWSGLGGCSEQPSDSFIGVSSPGNSIAKIKYRIVKFEFQVNLSF